jgi:cytochrome c oxidase cbb3-type subunit 3
MRPIPKSLPKFGLVLTLAISQLSFPQAKHNSSSKQNAATKLSSGRGAFNSSCAACHGLDGHGSDKAVNIATSPRVQHVTDTQLANIISNGIPGTGMPAFHTLTVKQVHEIVSYVRLLQGRVEQVSLPGDPKKGKQTFFGKGECSACHTMEGEGGFLGPDLTSHGLTSSVEAMREEIVRSPRVPPQGYRTASLATLGGDRLEGTIRNEDNFSVQLQTKDGSFHLFKRSDLQSFEYTGGSLMPTNYRERLTNEELNDLVAYLMSVSRGQKITPVPPKDEVE